MGEIVLLPVIRVSRRLEPGPTALELSELASVSGPLRSALIEREMVYLTEYEFAGCTYVGDVIAHSFEQADEVAARVSGRRVVGLMRSLPRNG